LRREKSGAGAVAASSALSFNRRVGAAILHAFEWGGGGAQIPQENFVY